MGSEKDTKREYGGIERRAREKISFIGKAL